MSHFTYDPSQHVPYRNKAVIEGVHRIKREEIGKHPNADYKIRVVPDAHLSLILLFDAFYRIKTAADNGEPIVLIMPKPRPMLCMPGRMLNAFRVDCRKLHTFNMDEHADQDGAIYA